MCCHKTSWRGFGRGPCLQIKREEPDLTDLRMRGDTDCLHQLITELIHSFQISQLLCAPLPLQEPFHAVLAKWASHPVLATGPGFKRHPQAHCSWHCSCWCSWRDPESCKRHCMVFQLTLMAAHLCDAIRTLKVVSREIIFLGISFQGKGFSN